MNNSRTVMERGIVSLRVTCLFVHCGEICEKFCVLSRRAVMYRNLENMSPRFCVRPSLNIPRPTKSREKRLRPSQECVGGRRDGGCARDEVEDGIGIANIPLLYLSGLSSLCDLSLRSSIDRPSHLLRPNSRSCTRCISRSMFYGILAGRQIVRFCPRQNRI